MKRLDHLLVILNEECTEIAKDCDKALRFGLNDSHRDVTNRENLETEFNQLLAMIEMLQEEGVDIRVRADIIKAKKLKVEHYLEHSRKMGRLED